MKITPQDHERIAAAITAAEAMTAGEITCVLTDEVSDYRETPLAWAGGSALVLPVFALLLGLRPDMLNALFGGWTVAHVAASDTTVLSALTTYIVVQAVVFLVVALIVSIPPLKVALTPKAVRAEKVHKAAMEQFLAKGLHRTRARTGVLLFVALSDHYAEVVADEGIYAVAPRQAWDEVVAALIAGVKRGKVADGFVEAVAKAGAILAAHVPPDPDNPNEAPDELSILPRKKKQ
jgi:putative membrane protein